MNENGTPDRLALFPLQTVLFPGGLLPLRVFEARYVDLISQCLREDTVFGVNLIAEGSEVGQPAKPCVTGTSARIVECDAPEPGLLHVKVAGERRYRVTGTETGPNGLLLADVEWLEERAPQSLPQEYAMLVAVLRAIMNDLGDELFPPPQHFNDADWVGMRLAGVLPIPMRARQALLDLEFPLDRLKILREYLEQQGLKQE
ncbi:MAG TPA: LON peptidase substrate-binding domain-containing protein [Azoarcus sp.]|nr:LON peptidase substrate-binding domain-containing protein [Azoarcus sp.]